MNIRPAAVHAHTYASNIPVSRNNHSNTSAGSVDSVSFKANIRIEDFHKVTEKLYRGAQPTLNDLRDLAQLGIKTIINFRTDRTKSLSGKVKVLKYKAYAKLLGIKLVNIPLNPYVAPSEAKIAKFFKTLDDSTGKVFIHCRDGVDRTGYMTAIFRIAKENKTFDEAFSEMRAKGHQYMLYPQFEKFLKEYTKTA